MFVSLQVDASRIYMQESRHHQKSKEMQAIAVKTVIKGRLSRCQPIKFSALQWCACSNIVQQEKPKRKSL